MTNFYLIVQCNPHFIDQGSIAATKVLQVISPVSEAYYSMTPRYHCVRDEDLTMCKNKGRKNYINQRSTIDQVDHLVIAIRAY